MNTGRELSTELGYQKSASMITTEQVSCYLTNHPNFLEQYIMDNVEMEQIERWIIRKSKKGRRPSDFEKAVRKTSLSRWKFCVHADKRKMLQSLTRKLQIKPSKDYVLWELANCISSAVNADGFRLFIVDKGDPNVLLLYPGEEHTQSSSAPHLQRMKKDISIALYVARTQQPVRLSRGKPDSRFSSEIMNELPARWH
nr:cAMP and cAMP-inhibited cGMP 3',5'-cyclic phosphodiesterase 10A-like [Leptinotarsa decemlineata]